jgi:hypothetical protein
MVYQFTETRKYEDASLRQKFLLDTRDLIAKRFRENHGSASEGGPNALPYLIGVFDTVAALGSFIKSLGLTIGFFILALLIAFFTEWLLGFIRRDWLVSAFDLPSWAFILTMEVGLAVAILAVLYIYTHFKADFAVPGYDWRQKLATMHRTELWLRFYDARLDANVPYAKHAISLDENRKDFARVGWGTKGDVWKKDALGNRRFEQVWFAGNHADIGGGYPENEARLSDITLQWMVQSAAAVPDGLVTDPNVLNLWPSPSGIQHDEVKAGYGWLANKVGITWARQDRALPIPKDGTTSEAIIHRSVYQRFDLKECSYSTYLAPTGHRHFACTWTSLGFT